MQYGDVRVCLGVHPGQWEKTLRAGERFVTPECVAVYSAEGFGGMTRSFHRAVRDLLIAPQWKNAARPVLINNWEATYFDFDRDKLLKIADRAAEIGVELFVLDDGWFGHRDLDTSSLGDWFEDRKKLPEGLGDLSCQIKKRGLKFGLWFEPEMISEDSDLYRKHPDWAIGCAGRCRMRMRHQLVLDLAREDVREYLFETLCGIIERAGLDYIKWDMNRYILDMPAADYSYRYTTGLYALLEKITAKYPDLLIEGCAGGGGRFDLGMLYYFPQIWASDNTDAIARLPIQEGTSFLYPLSAIGAHVTAVPNHQVGRVTPFKTRAAVSMFGNFGFELDLNKLSPEETEQAKRAVEFYKTYRSEIVGGEFYRLSAADAEVCAWQVTGERHVFVCAVQGVARAERFYAPLRLRALGGGELYRDLRDGAVYGGDELMRYGFHTGLRHEDFDARFFVFEKIFR